MSEPAAPLPEPVSGGRRSGRGALSGTASQRVERPAPLREAVHTALIELIINGTLQPGQHLVELELAQYLGVSRQPVREALQRLQTEGWVDLRPAQGAFVHTPTEEEADQLLSVRSVLETYSARLAAEHATEADMEHLQQLHDNGVQAMLADDAEGMVAANAALHTFITRMSRNEVLAEHVALVDRRVRWYYRPIARPRGRDAWAEHAELIRAIGQHDADLASMIMNRHTERTRQAYHDQRAAESS
ncbi:GntR family transcriptional regulator [Actinocrispum wychmicini]|uniref:DNA-binding GntR family transcriptional regulator n=1 Tax=Actinocrispum wychmicini TaxID=1213861 RepID=A0A4V2S691_9PSEU|nr:GntR family transcriptional regulator [Actinocrispum wychmicini]TCO55130.1 DNA-binding GntR family transcriptional regulator [Actinocrispum wychmicini]